MSTPHTTSQPPGGAQRTAAEQHEYLRYVGIVHGIVMVMAFSILFPVGATLLRVFRVKHLAWFHGIWQLVAWSLAISGFAMGVYISSHGGYGTFTSHNGHKQIGLVVILLMFLMPFLGIIHHSLWKKSAAPTLYGRTHRWLGRLNLSMGGINVGLGLMLGRAPPNRVIPYSVLTGFFFLIYFVVLAYAGPEAQKCKTTAVEAETPGAHPPRVSSLGNLGTPEKSGTSKEASKCEEAEMQSIDLNADHHHAL